MTDCITRSEEQEKDFGNPGRLGETVISQDDAYLMLALRTILAPVSGMVVFVAVNDTTTGTGLAASATCIPTTAIVATTIEAVMAIADFDRTLERNIGFLASYVADYPPGYYQIIADSDSAEAHSCAFSFRWSRPRARCAKRPPTLGTTTVPGGSTTRGCNY